MAECFYKKSPSIADANRKVGFEIELWEMASAKKLSLLTAPITGSLVRLWLADRVYGFAKHCFAL
jgi:hypothetical protein